MERDEVRAKVSHYMSNHGLNASDLARRLHPSMTGEDVTRFMNREEPLDEARREISVASVMAMFVYGLEPDECE